MTKDESPIVLLDACVLAPLIMREVLFAAAGQGLFRPRWSARIEEEWARAAGKEARGLSEAEIRGDLALARARFPEALVEGWEQLESPLSLPDWEDRHVLAAGIKAEASVLVTDNLRDFPRRRLAEHGIQPIGADAFVTDLANREPDRMKIAFDALHAIAPPEAMSAGLPALLKRGRLPRLAKIIRQAPF